MNGTGTPGRTPHELIKRLQDKRVYEKESRIRRPLILTILEIPMLGGYNPAIGLTFRSISSAGLQKQHRVWLHPLNIFVNCIVDSIQIKLFSLCSQRLSYRRRRLLSFNSHFQVLLGGVGNLLRPAVLQTWQRVQLLPRQPFPSTARSR